MSRILLAIYVFLSSNMHHTVTRKSRPQSETPKPRKSQPGAWQAALCLCSAHDERVVAVTGAVAVVMVAAPAEQQQEQQEQREEQ